MSTSVQMQYPGGAIAQFFCGMDACSDDGMQIYGTKGHISLQSFWKPSAFTVYAEGQEPRTYSFAQETEPYHYEFDHAAACILDGLTESPVMPLSESIIANRICT